MKEAHRLCAVTVEAMRVVYGRVNYHRNELDQRLCVAAISHIESDTCGGAEPCWDRRTVPWEMDIRRQQGVPRYDTNARHSLTEVGDPHFSMLEPINILAGSNVLSTASSGIWLKLYNDQRNAQVFFIYLSIYFCLTCFGISISPSSEAGV
jgi:hypothetical protein